MKCCTHCSLVKPRAAFAAYKKSSDGLRPWCRECTTVYMRAYRARNPEKMLALRIANQPKQNATRRARYRSDASYADRIRSKSLAGYAANRNARKIAVRLYQIENRDKVLAKKRAYYAAKKSMLSVAVKAWKKNNPEALRDYFHKRRALLKNAVGSHTREQIAELLERQNGLCAVCRVDIRSRRDRDHIVPLSAGGSNDISNIQLLCPPCNYAKRAKSMEQFLKERHARNGPEPIPGGSQEVRETEKEGRWHSRSSEPSA